MTLPEIARHELIELIGSGCCGSVYRARTMEGRECAVKVFSSMAINRKALTVASEVLAAGATHPGVVAPTAFGFERSPYFQVMPLLGKAVQEGGRKRWETVTLEDWCEQGLPEEKAWEVIYQLAEAMAWLHKQGLPHGNLRPCNVLVEEGGDPQVRLTDMAQGWVGGVHRLDLGDHFVYLCPEQAENPDGVFSGHGPGWDVYSFGVIAYRLLTGRLPRGDEAWNQQLEKARQQVLSGLAYEIDSKALLQAVRAEPVVTWPGKPPESEWTVRRRAVIEGALSLHPGARWRDMREVLREFEVLESDYQLAVSRAETVQAREKQARKVKKLSRQVLALGVGVIVVAEVAIWMWFRDRAAQKALAEVEAVHAAEVQQRETVAAAQLAQREEVIANLTRERDEAKKARTQSEANLAHAQEAVDQFLTQLLETPAGDELEVAFSRGQLEEALAFTKASLAEMEAQPELAAERARASGNLGRIHLKLRQDAEAEGYLRRAYEETRALVAATEEPMAKATASQWAGRYGMLLAELKQRGGRSDESLKLLAEAVRLLEAGLEARGAAGLARSECARAWLDLGTRQFEAGELGVARESLQRVGAVLDTTGAETKENKETKEGEVDGAASGGLFLEALAAFQLGRVIREEGRFEEAMTAMIDAVRSMGELVMGASPRNQEQALELARAYTELAELVGQHFNASDAVAAHEQAVPILLELNRLMPEWVEVKYLLARNYGAISQLERDLGQVSEATRKKQDAIALINEVLADDAGNVRFLLLQARLRHEYAGFLADSGKVVEAAGMARLAEATLEKLLAGAPELKAGERLRPDRREREVLLAQVLGVLAHSQEKSGKKGEAKTLLIKAQGHWQALTTAGATDDVVRQGLAWTQDRLSKLK